MMMTRLAGFVMASMLTVACGPSRDDYFKQQREENERLSHHIGKTACNATNGVYRGTITGLQLVNLTGSSQAWIDGGEVWVYEVRGEDGITRNAPINNVILDCKGPTK